MRSLWILFRKEMMGYFFSPIAYIVGVCILAVMGFSFFTITVILSEGPSDYSVFQWFFNGMFNWLTVLVVIPVITMRLFADEKKMGTIETLMTAPVRDWEYVLAKFLSGYVFYLVLWVPTFVYAFVLRYFSKDNTPLDVGPILGGYLGFFLVGMLLISMGCVASASTRNQIIAAVLAFAMGCAFFFTGIYFYLYGTDKYREVFEVAKDMPMAQAREIVAMVYDLRPVAQMQTDVDVNGEKILLQRLEVFTNAGFAIDKYEFPEESNQEQTKKSLNIFISKDSALAQEATKLFMESEVPPSKEFHNRFGQLMGFPQTAIDAYIEGDCLSQEEQYVLGFPKDHEDGPCVIPFGLSRKHYTEEVEYLKKYFRALKEVFPDTYGTTLLGETLTTYRKEVESFLKKDFTKTLEYTL